MRGSMDAFKFWIVMGVGYLVPRALEAGVPSVVIHNVGERSFQTDLDKVNEGCFGGPTPK